MSTPEEHTWGDIINAIISTVKEVLYQVASFIKENAVTIAEAMVGIAIAYFVYRKARRMLPVVSGFFRA